MSLFLYKVVGEHLHSENTIPSFNVLSLEGSAHPTSPFYKFFNGNTWADIKRILKSFIDSILSSPSLFIQPRVTKVDSRKYKNIKPCFCEMNSLIFICRKIRSDVFCSSLHMGILSTFSSSIIHIGQFIKSTVKSTMLVAGGLQIG